MLRRMSRSPRATNDDLIQYLTVVAESAANLGADPRPTPKHGEARSPVTRRCPDVERYRRQAHALYLNCLVLARPTRYGRNQRAPANIRAAQILGETAAYLGAEDREALSARIRRVVDRHFLKVKAYAVSEDVLEAVFLALARLGSLETLEWILKEHVHARVERSDYLLTAHRSLVRYRSVPGDLRYRIVKKFIRVYVPIERFAEGKTRGGQPRDGLGMMARRLWYDIRSEVREVVRYYAARRSRMAPRIGTKPPTRMSEFEAWFRRHKDPRKAPWVDPKPRPAK